MAAVLKLAQYMARLPVECFQVCLISELVALYTNSFNPYTPYLPLPGCCFVYSPVGFRTHSMSLFQPCSIYLLFTTFLCLSVFSVCFLLLKFFKNDNYHVDFRDSKGFLFGGEE